MQGSLDAPFVSVVIGCRNEAENVDAMTLAVSHELESLQLPFELIYIDNDSTDNTVELVLAQCDKDPRVKLIQNQSNFGQLRSPVHALFQATGDVIVGMCADFQDPPTLIPQFIDAWRDGFQVVLGVRQEEQGTGAIHRILRSLGYKFAEAVFDQKLIANATGFGLYDRKVMDVIKSLNEPEPLVRTLVLEFGWPVKTIAFHRPERAGGRSNNNFFTLVDFSVSALSSSAKKFCRYATYLGVLLMFLSMVVTVIAIMISVRGEGSLGWWLAAGIELQLSLMFIFVGLLGDQIRMIGERVRGTPLVVEKARTNFPVASDS